jgi:SNF2 family DNA or RNA helicase
MQKQTKRREHFVKWISEGERWKSTKIIWCADGIEKELQERPGNILVLSPFLSALDVMGVALKKRGIAVLRYDGSMSAEEKADALEKFAASGGARVLLITSGAGGEGLNLQSATSVWLLNLYWNLTRQT